LSGYTETEVADTMSKQASVYKYITIVATLTSAVFIFFDWFRLSIPILDTFLESGTIQISYMTLPSLVEKNALGLIVRMGGKTTAATTLILCALLKYLCVLSAGIGICGVWKMCIKERISKMVFVSQIIAIALQFVAFIVIIIINVFISMYAPGIAETMNVSPELIDFNFIPTFWVIIATVSAIVSLVFSQKYISALEFYE